MMSGSKRAIVITAGDALIDYDVPYLSVVPALFEDIFAEHIGNSVQGVLISPPQEDAVRDIHCSSKAVLDILESCLFIQQQNSDNDDYADLHDVIAEAVGLTEQQINDVVLSEQEREAFLEYIDPEDFEGGIDSALRYAKRDHLLRKALEPYQARMDAAISEYLAENGPFLPEVREMLGELLRANCDVRVIHIRDEKSGYPCDIRKALSENAGVPEAHIRSLSLRQLEGKDVKDIFPELEYVGENNILVCSNHIGLLSRSIGLDFSSLDRLSAEFEASGAGFSRMKDAPYHVCMIGYNKSRPDIMKPSSVRGDHILVAESPSDLLTHVDRFLSGCLLRSFSHVPDNGREKTGGVVLHLPKNKI